jgi:hypothetical protein
MVWFIGAVLGCAQVGHRAVTHPGLARHPIQGFAFAAVMGAVVYGSILWLLSRLF